MTTREDLTWWLETAPTLKWRYATTMPDSPHSYVVRGEMLPEADFVRAVKVIRTFGEPGKFWARTNVYLVDGDRKWWTMGEPIEQCEIINTATTERRYGRQDAPHTRSGRWSVYDELATVYDARYTSARCRAENQAVRMLIARHFGAYAPQVLDVGCGTGLLLDLKVTHPALYTGVDPSQGMLNELVRKHPKVNTLVPATMEDALDGFWPRQFDAVVALFGSPSYIAPDVVKALPSLSGDLTVLMHYREGYLPDYWRGRPDPDYVDASREAATLGGRTFRLNDFEVTVVDGL